MNNQSVLVLSHMADDNGFSGNTSMDAVDELVLNNSDNSSTTVHTTTSNEDNNSSTNTKQGKQVEDETTTIMSSAGTSSSSSSSESQSSSSSSSSSRFQSKQQEQRASDDEDDQFAAGDEADDDVEIEIPDSIMMDDVSELGAEDDEGNTEYKLFLKPSKARFERLVTQMNFRLAEGSGEAIYEIGVEDDGHVKGLDADELESSLETLRAMAAELGAGVQVVKRREGDSGQSAVCLVRRIPAAGESCVDLRIAVAGNVDSGKSTLIGVLVGGKLDNGRGLARSQVFNHPHEIETGRTSSISHQILGFDNQGEVTNYSQLHNYSWSEIVANSAKVLSFIDLAGHKRYLKTTISGLTGHIPDYCMLMMAANNGITRMTKEHLGIALAMKIPVMCVVTKIDICPKHVFKDNLKTLVRILKSPGADKKMPVIVKNEDDVIKYAKEICNNRVVPIFLVSNVTGENLDLVRSFLNLVPARREWDARAKKPAEFYITDDFYVTGVGTVVSGILTQGVVKSNDTLWLGPTGTGEFVKASVKSIHYQRMAVKQVTAGQSCCFALKRIKRSSIRRGMVMLGVGHEEIQSAMDFEADVLILHHSTTIRLNYQPVVHSATVRQAASIVGMDKEYLRTGDKTRVKFRFTNRPEFLKVGEKIVFCEGRTRGIGVISAVGTGDKAVFTHSLVADKSGKGKGKMIVSTTQSGEDDEEAGSTKISSSSNSSSNSSSSAGASSTSSSSKSGSSAKRKDLTDDEVVQAKKESIFHDSTVDKKKHHSKRKHHGGKR